MTEATVSAGFVRALIEFAVAKGAGRDALVRDAELDAAALADRDARIPFARYVALMHAAKARTGDDALALHFGELVQIAHVSIVGLIGQASETILEALVQLNRYVRLVVDIECSSADRFDLRRENGALWMVDTRLDPNSFPDLTESAFAQIVCRPPAAGLPHMALEVQVTHPAPAYVAEYERIFKAPIHFNAPRNAVRLDEAVVEHRVAILPRYVFGVLTERADAQLQALETEGTTRSAVKRLLLPVLHTGDVSIETVAAKLGISRQTLWRNLKSEGVTFEQVHDELRRDMALDYLAARKVSVHETAYLVGFSDPAAFSRAFKRWTGMSPSEARKRP